MQKQRKIAIVLLLFLLWGAFSWRWYTCGVKGFCAKEIAVESIKAEKQEEPAEFKCGPYLLGFVRAGEKNNPAHVRRVEEFLNRVEGESLAVNGLYEDTDIAAVKRFQEKYRADVLSPWNMKVPSGHVYQTTRKQINKLFCAYQLRLQKNK